ncbi:MAG: hypothetical protein ACHQE5_01790 [Actinomycetes bacterium]
MSAVGLDPDRPRTTGTRAGAHAAPPRRLPTAWPLAALLLGYPLWWALGIAPLVWTLFAIPMVFQLSRRRPIKLPPMFWVWALFLSLVVISGLMVDIQAPDTLPVNGGPGHYIAYAIRLLNYLSVTLVMIYTGNLTERELPRLRLIRWLGVVFVVTVVGGLLGTFAPHFGYDSPIKAFLPASLQSIDFVQQFTHIESAQVQTVLGYPRPSAPFEYANAWGNNYSMLLVWFVIGWLLYASDRRRVVALVVLAVSVVPVVYSQNRGMWVGLVLGALYVALRLALQRRYAILLGLGIAAGLVGAAVVLSPLQDVVTARIATPHSNEVRGSLSLESLKVAATSPIGYGSTRSTIGSDKSATIGQSPGCPRCGNRVIGSTGQLWLLLVAQGYPGAILYLLFLFQGVIRYWRDHSVVGIGGTLVLLLGIFYSLFYTSVVSPLAITLMGMALLWRNDQARREQRAAELAAEREGGPRLFAGGDR